VILATPKSIDAARWSRSIDGHSVDSDLDSDLDSDGPISLPLSLPPGLGDNSGSNTAEIQSLETSNICLERGSQPTNEPANRTNTGKKRKRRGKKKRLPLKITNGTRSSLVAFEGFISKDWICSSKEVLQILEHQLKFCGGFCHEMKELDFSTPANVRIRSTKLTEVRVMLKKKTSISVIKSVEKFILPNIEVLKSRSMVKKVLSSFRRLHHSD